MSEFVHQRHKPVTSLREPRELIIACPEMQSHINVSRMVRAAACCGVTRFIACGNVKIDSKISRGGEQQMSFEVHRSLRPVLQKLQRAGYPLIGLEQTTNSQNIHQFKFSAKCILIIGHERKGIADDVLEILDQTIEIPVWGEPFSYNAATAASMALYEYCRQFPS